MKTSSKIGQLRRCARTGCRRRGSSEPYEQALHEDPALKWARENPQVARACLHLPSIAATTSPIPTRFLSFEDYWSFRGWKWPRENDHYAKNLVSHVLSAPLTVASLCFLGDASRSMPSRQMHWCCVGARAEASLPVMYWRESLQLVPKLEETPAFSFQDERSNRGTHFLIDFVGPDIVRHPDVSLVFNDNAHCSLTLRWCPRPGLLHHVFQKQEKIPHELDSQSFTLDSYDGFILLNPGIGHPSLQHDWQPTIELLLEAGKPILTTAHSQLDVEREEQCWVRNYGVPDMHYQTNLFSSRIKYLDPLETEKEHWVSPNFAVAFRKGVEMV